ncbi:MAG: hypothetical protein HYY93_06805 [Planctomycetes bacterium]|nr:hypothetical protein [Planctomycetota bacterium]
MSADRVLDRLGFRAGERGTHTCRTIMLEDLARLLGTLPQDAPREDYVRSIVEDNLLGKQTTSTRVLTAQRLSELYALDPAIPLFRTLRRVWALDEDGRPLLAMLCALARDPLLRATADSVLDTPPGEDLSRQRVKDAVRDEVGSRLNESSLDKTVRNTASSWTQSRHLTGRSRKIRRRVSATPGAAAYALFLGYLQGHRSQRLFQTPWTKALDATARDLMALAAEAKRLGFLDMKIGADAVEVRFPSFLTAQEDLSIHGTD